MGRSDVAAPSSEMLHASTVAIQGRAVLIEGLSGSGKSDLALRLIDRGAALVSDDYTLVKHRGDGLVACAAPNIAGKIEVRGLGIIAEDPKAANALRTESGRNIRRSVLVRSLSDLSTRINDLTNLTGRVRQNVN